MKSLLSPLFQDPPWITMMSGAGDSASIRYKSNERFSPLELYVSVCGATSSGDIPRHNCAKAKGDSSKGLLSPNALPNCEGKSRANLAARSGGLNESAAAATQNMKARRPLHELPARKTAIARQINANACPHSVTPTATFHRRRVGARKTAKDAVTNSTDAAINRKRSKRSPRTRKFAT